VHKPLSVGLAIEAGLKVADATLVSQARNAPERLVPTLGKFLASDRDRDRQKEIARNDMLWAAFEDDDLVTIWSKAANSGEWEGRECAALMAGAVGERLLLSSRGAQVADRWKALCNDSDKDVAKAADTSAERWSLETGFDREDESGPRQQTG